MANEDQLFIRKHWLLQTIFETKRESKLVCSLWTPVWLPFVWLLRGFSVENLQPVLHGGILVLDVPLTPKIPA